MTEIMDALLRMRSNLYCEAKFAQCRSVLGTLGHSSLWCYSPLPQHLSILLRVLRAVKEAVSVILRRKFKLPTRTVVEDIGMGLAAAEVAGMKCIVTKSRYTAEEDFQNAYANFDFFEDSPEERFYLGTCRSLLSNSSSL
ncbi:hypothetical protein TB2_028645 [Malus domestica]